MKAMIFNCHGKMKIAPSFKVIPADKNVIFLCKEGKTLSVDQVKEFVNHLLAGNSIDYAITNSPSVAIDRDINPKQVLDIYSNLKIEEKNIKDPILLKIARLKIEKLDSFLQSMFDQHTKVERIIPDLTLSHDDVANGVVSQIVNHLKTNSFTNIGITIYGDTETNKDQLFLLCNFQQLKNENKVDVVYVTPSQHILPQEFSYYIEKFYHAYLLYNQTNILEAFLNFKSDNSLLDGVNKYVTDNPGSYLYDFGQENSNILLGACREYDGFNFGHEV
jgi:hypothetical protein